MAFVLAGSSLNYLDLLDDLETFATANGWTTKAASKQAVSAAVAAGGTGYTVGDQLTLVTGTGTTFGPGSAVFNVDTVSAGAVTAVSLVTAGAYHYVAAPTPVATTGGTGTGATLTVTYANTNTSLDGKRLILEGIGSGSDQIFVGIAAFDQGGNVIGWNVHGFTGFQDEVDFFNQPGVSPGNTIVPLGNGVTTHWFFVTGRRMICVFRIGTSYLNMYLGFINQFGTSTDFPYPLLVGGCSSLNVIFSDSLAGMSGMNDPIYHTTTGVPFGPMQLRLPSGLWKPLANSAGALSFRSVRREAGITPPGEILAANKTWSDFIPLIVGSPTFTYRQTPDSTAATNFRFPLIPSIVWESVPQSAIHGELDNVFWAGTLSEGSGQAIPEDVYNVNGDDYILFPNCNRSDHWANFLIKKE